MYPLVIIGFESAHNGIVCVSHPLTPTNYVPHALRLRLQANFKYNCEDLTSMQINTHSGQCRSSVVNFFIDVDPYDFEVALVNAVEHSGHRLRFRNYRPIADNNTETGWNGAWDLAPGPMDVP